MIKVLFIYFLNNKLKHLLTIYRSLTLPQVLQLKVGAKVMLVTTLSKELVNGSTGIVTGFSTDSFPIVKFDDVAIVTVKPVTLSVKNRNDPSKLIGKRTQIPLKLCWAITAHKSQGMTLPCLEVHCGSEFTSGQMYVAMSRAKDPSGLSLVGFNNAKMIPPPKIVEEFYGKIQSSNAHVLASTTECCCKSEYNDDCTLQQRNEATQEQMSNMPDISEDELNEIDKLINSFFEENRSPELHSTSTIDLDELLEDLDCMDDLASPGDDFDIKKFLNSLRLAKNENRPLVNDINTAIDILMSTDCFEGFQKFLRIQWNRIYEKIKECINQHKKVERKNFSSLFGEMHSLFTSDNIAVEFASVLSIVPEQLSIANRCLKTEILSGIKTFIIHKIIETRVPESSSPQENMDYVNVKEMPAESRGKIRYCMAWAIAKQRDKCRADMRLKMCSTNPSVRSSSFNCYTEKKLFESLTISSDVLEKDSEYPETLTVTESRQFRNRGLTSIRDDVYLLALEIEEKRVTLLNMAKLKQFKGNVLEKTTNELKESNNLRSKWLCLFPADTATVALYKIYEDVIERYMNMAGAQFLRNFRRDTQLQKTEAHRKKVLLKSKKQELKGGKVDVDTILNDNSNMRQTSHILLKAMIAKLPDIFKSRVYKKDELKMLLDLYGIVYNSSSNKNILAEALKRAIQELPGFPQRVSSNSSTTAINQEGMKTINIF